MTPIDLSQMITAEVKARTRHAAQRAAHKDECRSRICAVVTPTAQLNLAAAAAARRLSKVELGTYRAGLDWIEAMRKACATGDWPEVPEGFTALVQRF